MSDMSNHHRLCIFSNFLGFLSSKPFGPRLRTLVCFSDDEVQVPREDGSAIPAGFKLLRVLDAKPLKFAKIPRDMHRLVLLRFLVLSLDSAILPANIAKLWNLQTLIVDTTSRTLEIKADLCKLTQFRHLRTNATATLATLRESKGGDQLQTLANISPESCTEELLYNAHNLKKLGIRGKISCFFEGTTGSFDSLVRLIYLENLKLVNDVFPSPPSEGRLRSLPQPYKFPSRLRSLTLAQTYLDWSQMYNLGLLENLQVLKLKDHAFTGHNWEANDGCFRELETLHIEYTDLVIWKASAHHFPSLRSLKLHCCQKLQEVPIQLADIPSLQRLVLYHTNLAATSAATIGDKIKIQENGQGPRREFQLSIYPPIQ